MLSKKALLRIAETAARRREDDNDRVELLPPLPDHCDCRRPVRDRKYSRQWLCRLCGQLLPKGV